MTMSVEDAIGLARILKEELNSMRTTLSAHSARLAGLEETSAVNAELQRENAELKKQLEATRKSTVIKLRAAGGGA